MEDPTSDQAPAAVPFPTLTPRERVIATRLAQGARNAEIADELEISVKTVDTHRAHVLKKLGLRGNVELAHLAIVEGWVTPERFGTVTA